MKLNLLASYATQAYVSVIGLLLMPLYMREMGAEAFGLIGIFWFLQAALQLLDLGLTPTVSRQMSRFRAGVITGADAAQALKATAWLFAGLSLLVVAAFALARQWLTAHWLGTQTLPAEQVGWCLVAMAVAASARWMSGLYRAAMVGLELQARVNALAATFATLRFVGVVPVILLVSAAPWAFFAYQVLVGFLELLATRRAFRVGAPGIPETGTPAPRQLLALAPLAGAMAFMSSAWIFQTQVDKLVLSKLLALHDYGRFTLAAMVASGVLIFVPPLNQVLQPRLSVIVAGGDDAKLQALYSLATQCTTTLFGALGVTIALFATPILHVWTADAAAAESAGPILFWYGLANALAGLLVLPFTLQFAHGYLRLQVLGAGLFAVLLLPALVVLVGRFGASGAGMALLGTNLVYLVCWVPIAHRRLLGIGAWKWLPRDVLPAALAIVGFVLLASRAARTIDGRWQMASVIAGVFISALVVGLLAGGRSRLTFVALFRKPG